MGLADGSYRYFGSQEKEVFSLETTSGPSAVERRSECLAVNLIRNL